MNKPLISVIVPVYNVSDYISKCLDSLINQTLKDIEIIIVNDGSPDDSEVIIKKYMKKDKRIRCFKKTNGGQGSARNYGIEKAKGIYITFVDSDDYISRDMLKKLYNSAIKEKSDIAICNMKEINGKQENIIKLENFSTDLKKNCIISIPTPCAKIIRKEIITNNNLFFPQLRAYEDLAIVPLYYLFARRISYVNEELYYYVIHKGSTMNQIKYNSKLEEIFPAMNNLYSELKKYSFNITYRDEIEYIYIVHLLHAASLRVIDFKEGQDFIKKIIVIFKSKFPNWFNNKYYKKRDIKFKIMCTLLFNNKLKLIKILRSKK